MEDCGSPEATEGASLGRDQIIEVKKGDSQESEFQGGSLNRAWSYFLLNSEYLALEVES